MVLFPIHSYLSCLPSQRCIPPRHLVYARTITANTYNDIYLHKLAYFFILSCLTQLLLVFINWHALLVFGFALTLRTHAPPDQTHLFPQTTVATTTLSPPPFFFFRIHALEVVHMVACIRRKYILPSLFLTPFLSFPNPFSLLPVLEQVVTGPCSYILQGGHAARACVR
jgi:hypothetical protein